MPLLDPHPSRSDVHHQTHHWLARFALDSFIHHHTLTVITALPPTVRQDFMLDPSFSICDYESGPGAVMSVSLSLPGRGVILKRSLRRRPLPFVRWLIAHELAHAYLRNEGRWPGDDPEHAADALAAQWGFPKPVS